MSAQEQAEQAAAAAAAAAAAQTQAQTIPGMTPAMLPFFGARATTVAQTAATATVTAMGARRPDSYSPDTRATGRLDALKKDGSNWMDFSIKLKSHVRAQDIVLANMMEETETGTEVPDIDLMEPKQNEGTATLQHNLTMLTVGTSLKLVKSTKDGNGVVSYQKLAAQWDVKTDNMALSRLTRILQGDFKETDRFASQLVSFKYEIDTWEKQMVDEKFPDSIETAVVCCACNEPLADYLRLHASGKKFEQVEKLALEFMKLKYKAKDQDANGRRWHLGKRNRKGSKRARLEERRMVYRQIE